MCITKWKEESALLDTVMSAALSPYIFPRRNIARLSLQLSILAPKSHREWEKKKCFVQAVQQEQKILLQIERRGFFESSSSMVGLTGRGSWTIILVVLDLLRRVELLKSWEEVLQFCNVCRIRWLRRLEPVLFSGLLVLARAPTIASSKTSLRFLWVSAEHSTYVRAPTRFDNRIASNSSTGFSPYRANSIRT